MQKWSKLCPAGSHDVPANIQPLPGNCRVAASAQLALRLRHQIDSIMDVTKTAFGTWNGGRFMHFGEALDEARWIGSAQRAYEKGVRTFISADVYGNGLADELLGKALKGIPRDTYCLVGAVGHDFYTGKRDGSKGFPRFTNPDLRGPAGYREYLKMATEKSLERCGSDHFDVVMLHNPDSIGYSDDRVWQAMHSLVDDQLTSMLGVAPGPANGFTLDLIQCFERFGPQIDWAMIILNPFEPWPGSLLIPAAVKNGVQLITRVVDFGGLFHDDVRPGHAFGYGDHRTFRPAGWVEAGNQKLDQIRSIAHRHGITLLQLACAWNLAHPPVKTVVPTLIQEVGAGCKSIEAKVDELAALPDVALSAEEIELIGRVGDNRGCMHLKGANRAHTSAPVADQWAITPELEEIGRRWGIDPDRDLVCTHG